MLATIYQIISSKGDDLQPRDKLSDLLRIDFSQLRSQGKKYVIMDVDQTIVQHGQSEISFEMLEAIDSLKDIFGVSNLCFLTNELNTKRNQDIQEKTGIRVIRPATKKPDAEAFQSALQHMNVDNPSNVVMIGGRLFTDVLGGNQLGMHTIKVTPLNPRIDPWGVKQARRIETLYESLGIPTMWALLAFGIMATVLVLGELPGVARSLLSNLRIAANTFSDSKIVWFLAAVVSIAVFALLTHSQSRNRDWLGPDPLRYFSTYPLVFRTISAFALLFAALILVEDSSSIIFDVAIAYFIVTNAYMYWSFSRSYHMRLTR